MDLANIARFICATAVAFVATGMVVRHRTPTAPAAARTAMDVPAQRAARAAPTVRPLPAQQASEQTSEPIYAPDHLSPLQDALLHGSTPVLRDAAQHVRTQLKIALERRFGHCADPAPGGHVTMEVVGSVQVDATSATMSNMRLGQALANDIPLLGERICMEQEIRTPIRIEAAALPPLPSSEEEPIQRCASGDGRASPRCCAISVLTARADRRPPATHPISAR